MDAEATVRSYYACLDDARYDDLRDVLAPGFTQRRPDRTFDGRDAFCSFMTENRPHSDTTHDLDGVFVEPPTDDRPHGGRPERDGTGRSTAGDGADPSGEWTPTAGDEAETVLARGTVVRENGDVIVRFVDCFDVLADRIVALDTYTR
ncbi:nuclear transport factor 2 family protein [Halorubellus salinus]|uniref:nuclear transport factor 2 family protein n=1 Tax=Halorubellus salinus TaxID=755309 RepID=UPI001D08C47D|nr:nuclear transport factor 2 family protein [Halorubellus salinus]